VIFTQSGANDPSFNLRSEPGFILRSKGESTVFASVIETHGYFNEAFEQSVSARGEVKDIQVLGYNEQGSVVAIDTASARHLVMVSSQQGATEETKNSVKINGKTYSWKGFFAVEMETK
jgi:hypothetical protein